MPDVLRIKRRNSGGAGAPLTLANAELAYNEVEDILYYGKGNNAGQAVSIIPIAGPGFTSSGGSTVTIGDTPPPTPTVGSQWFDSVSANMYLWFNDGTSSQWVPTSNQNGSNTTLPISSGGTGATTAAAALTNLGAVAKTGDSMTGQLRITGGSGSYLGAPSFLSLVAANGAPWLIVFQNTTYSSTNVAGFGLSNTGILGLSSSIVNANNSITIYPPNHSTNRSIALSPSGGLFVGDDSAYADPGAGNVLMGGYIRTYAKGSMLGSASGTDCGTAALATTDSNLLMYIASTVNWAGMGSDTSGNIWFRAALSGTPLAQFLVISNIPAVRVQTAIVTDVSYYLRNPQHTWRMLIQNGNGDLWFYDDNRAAVVMISSATNGAMLCTNGTWGSVSDRSVKQDVQPYPRGLEAIIQLNPIVFRYKAGTTFAPKNEVSDLKIGLAAEEVEPIMPEVCGEAMFGVMDGEAVNLKYLEPGNIIYALINSVKELKAELDLLKQTISGST